MNNIFLFSYDQESQHEEEKPNMQEEKEMEAPYIFDQQEIQKNQDQPKTEQQEKEEDFEEKIIIKSRKSFMEMDNIFLTDRTVRKNMERHIEDSKISVAHEKGKEFLPGTSINEVENYKVEYLSQKKALKVPDLRNFIHMPLGEYKIRAIIKKQSSGLFNTNTKYSLFIQQNNRFIFSVLRNGLSSYIFSLSKENITIKNKNYLGFMNTNFSGTNFLLYDNGFNPNDTRSLEFCRKQIASITYEQSKGPRKFEALITTNSKGFYALEEEVDVLKKKWDKKQKQHIKKLYSKTPEFDPVDGNYKLDFKGMVKEASVKNFILTGDDGNDSLIFGKIDNQTFIMEVKEPFSVFQATAICISSIHYKVHW